VYVKVEAAFNVVERGRPDGPVLLFAHGYGCDQTMWRYVAPAFEQTHRVLLFDFVGCGDAQAPYDPDRYSTLNGYAADVLRICTEMNLADVTFVGHSVAAMVGVLAANAQPDLVRALIMVGPSPRYLDDENYIGGFKSADIESLLSSLSSNYVGWAGSMAPAIMANPDQPQLAGELEAAFCRVDPFIAENFAKATFLSDNREDLGSVVARTLVLQCRDDIIAPEAVGQYVADRVVDSELVVLDATGHCPHMSAPHEVTAAMRNFLQRAA